MVKLTVEQKESNKAERRILEKSFKVARKVYEDDELRSLREFDLSPLKLQMDVASDAWDKGFAARDQDRKAILGQIAFLEQQITDLPVKHNLEQLNQVRRSTHNAYYQGLREVEKVVDARHPHVARVYSAVQWAENVRIAQALEDEVPEDNGIERMRSS